MDERHGIWKTIAHRSTIADWKKRICGSVGRKSSNTTCIVTMLTVHCKDGQTEKQEKWENKIALRYSLGSVII